MAALREIVSGIQQNSSYLAQALAIIEREENDVHSGEKAKKQVASVAPTPKKKAKSRQEAAHSPPPKRARVPTEKASSQGAAGDAVEEAAEAEAGEVVEAEEYDVENAVALPDAMKSVLAEIEADEACKSTTARTRLMFAAIEHYKSRGAPRMGRKSELWKDVYCAKVNAIIEEEKQQSYAEGTAHDPAATRSE